MATYVQQLRGSASTLALLAMSQGNIAYDKTNKTLRVFDGTQPGGYPLARADGSNLDLSAFNKPTSVSTLNINDTALIGNAVRLRFAADLGNAASRQWQWRNDGAAWGTLVLSVSDANNTNASIDVLKAYSSGQITQYGNTFNINGDSGSYAQMGYDAGGLWFFERDGGRAIRFYTGGAERMQMQSNGTVLMGKTATGFATPGIDFRPNGNAMFTRDGGVTVQLNRLNSDGDITDFYRSTQKVGSISVTASSTAYNTSSDYRLKQDFEPISDAIVRLSLLRPKRFRWKAEVAENPNAGAVDGFVAHEAQAVVPEAVTGEKDAVEAIGTITDAEGNVVAEGVVEPTEPVEGQTWTKTGERPVYQGIDQAKLVPLLTAALQEAVARIETLENALSDVTARVAALEAA